MPNCETGLWNRSSAAGDTFTMIGIDVKQNSSTENEGAQLFDYRTLSKTGFFAAALVECLQNN
jgi:hypothetical protein